MEPGLIIGDTEQDIGPLGGFPDPARHDRLTHSHGTGTGKTHELSSIQHIHLKMPPA
jgi:hypothetical protein